MADLAMLADIERTSNTVSLLQTTPLITYIFTTIISPLFRFCLKTYSINPFRYRLLVLFAVLTAF